MRMACLHLYKAVSVILSEGAARQGHFTILISMRRQRPERCQSIVDVKTLTECAAAGLRLCPSVTSWCGYDHRIFQSCHDMTT